MGVTLSRELLRAARRGDRAAYNQVGRWLIDELVAYYRRQNFRYEEVADLSQETALRIVSTLEDTPEDPELFRALTIGFARRVAQEYRTRDGRHQAKQVALSVRLQTPARRPDSLLSVRRLLAWVREEFNRLPSPYRRAFERMLDRDNYKEVAEDLDVPEGTARRRVWRVRRWLDSARARRRRDRS